MATKTKGKTKPKTTYTRAGQRVITEPCPKCDDTLVVQMYGATEVFMCRNCRFKRVTPKKTKK